MVKKYQPDESETTRLARLGLLIALAGAVQVFEYAIPSPVPWFRLGLGNALILAALHIWGVREAAWVALGKVLVGSLVAGRLFTPGFLLSLGGTASASAAMAIAVQASPPLGFIGVSLIGAQAHAMAQLALAGVLLGSDSLWSLAPLFSGLSLFSGTLTGFAGFQIAKALASDAAE